eukprot:5764986-Pyramimonas_sp.AAC.1
MYYVQEAQLYTAFNPDVSKCAYTTLVVLRLTPMCWGAGVHTNAARRRGCARASPSAFWPAAGACVRASWPRSCRPPCRLALVKPLYHWRFRLSPQLFAALAGRAHRGQ